MKILNNLQNEKLSILKKRDPKLQVRVEPRDKLLAYIRGDLSEAFDLELLNKDPFTFGKQYLHEYKELFGNLDMEKDLIEDKKVIDNIGMLHISFQQRYQNIPVYGGSVRINFSSEGHISSITCKLVPGLEISTDAKISALDAAKIAIKHTKKNVSIFKEREPQLIIYKKNGKYYLCWYVELDGLDQPVPTAWIYFIDAITGQIIHRYNNLQDAGPSVGNGTGYYSGTGTLNTYDPGTNTYQLRDTTRSSSAPPGPEIITNNGDVASPSEDPDNNWNDLTTNPRDKNQGAEVDSHKYAGTVVDYFLTHGRNSYDDGGSNIRINVHYGNDYSNGFWYPPTQQIYLGDGDGIDYDYICSNDWLAHEITHAYTEHTCGLEFDGEAGAINEAISDCFAAFIDGDWLVFEDTFLKGTAPAARNMADPTNGGQYDPTDPITSMQAGHQPDHYDDCYTGGEDNGGVHINSGIINHAIYLMTVGGTHSTSGVIVSGIGQTAVETILFNVITVQLLGNINADFLDFREAMLNSCLDLYPEDLEKLITVKAAFKAVGIGPDLYLRDTTSDVGLEPNPAGVSYISPDIIIKKNLPADPQSEFTDPTRSDLSESIEYGQDNYVFVRITNGGNHSADAEVDIYFCPVTTFATPAAWQFIGTIIESNITPGEFRISDHLVFPSNEIPSPGHYCFIGVIRNPLDPAPDHNLINSVSEFHDYIQYSNNYAWKNTNVVDDIVPGLFNQMQFDVRGMPNTQMRTNLEIDLRFLPEDTEFEILLPEVKVRGVDFSEFKHLVPRTIPKEYFIKKVQGLRPLDLKYRIFHQNGTSKFKIKSHRIGIFKGIMLKPEEVVRATINIKIPEKVKSNQFTFSIKQSVDRIVVGQINYVLRLK